MLASLGDNTPEGKSILTLAGKSHTRPGASWRATSIIPFSAETRLSGWIATAITIARGGGRVLRYLPRSQGGAGAHPQIGGQHRPPGRYPLLVCTHEKLLGWCSSRTSSSRASRRFQILRHMGIRTVMITGDNPLTAAAIAAEAGVDDFIAEATPEKKLAYIRQEQADGRLVAMCGDGANDAPALAQADVGLAMNEGTQAARRRATWWISTPTPPSCWTWCWWASSCW